MSPRIAVFLAALALSGTACSERQERNAEADADRAGDRVEAGAKEVGNELKEAGNEAKEATKRAGEKLDNAVEGDRR